MMDAIVFIALFGAAIMAYACLTQFKHHWDQRNKFSSYYLQASAEYEVKKGVIEKKAKELDALTARVEERRVELDSRPEPEPEKLYELEVINGLPLTRANYRTYVEADNVVLWVTQEGTHLFHRCRAVRLTETVAMDKAAVDAILGDLAQGGGMVYHKYIDHIRATQPVNPGAPTARTMRGSRNIDL